MARKRLFLLSLFLFLGAGAAAWWWVKSVPAAPSEAASYEPQKKLLTWNSRKVEIVYVEPLLGRPWPAVVWLNDEQSAYDPKVLQRWADKGYLAVAVSEPGQGESEGKPDFGGPTNQSVLKATIQWLRSREDVRSGDIAIYGIRIGAVTVANVIAKDTHIAGAIFVDGIFDFKRILPKWHKNKWAKKFRQEAGSSSSALRDRSQLHQTPTVDFPILAIEEQADTFSNLQQSHNLVQKLKRRNYESKLLLVPKVTEEIVDDFLSKALRRD